MAADEAADARIAREIQEADARAFRQAQHQAAAPGAGPKAIPAPPALARQARPAVWPCIIIPVVFLILMLISGLKQDEDYRVTHSLGIEGPSWAGWYGRWTVYAILTAAGLISYELVQVRRLLSRRS
jgi:hypothetical protein